MSVGEINKGAVVLILVLLLGGGGYLWWSQMYKPAVAERVTAEATSKTAQASLTQARTELEAAQKRVEDAKSSAAKGDDALSRLAIALAAIPRKQLIDDAAIVLVDMADRSGIDTTFESTVSENGAGTDADTASSGTTPIDLTFEATGTYAEMMQFMSLVEGNVQTKDGKLYAKGRLFNVVKLEIGAKEEDEGGAQADFGGAPVDESAPVLGPNDIVFTVVVRMYTSSTESAQSSGAATPDPAAAPTDPMAAGAGGGAPGTDPSATGAPTSTEPGAGTATTDPAAPSGSTPGADPAASATTSTTTATAGAPA